MVTECTPEAVYLNAFCQLVLLSAEVNQIPKGSSNYSMIVQQWNIKGLTVEPMKKVSAGQNMLKLKA